MAETIEKDVPSTSPWILRASLGLLAASAPFLITAIGQGIAGSNLTEMLLGVYGAGAASLAGYFITKGLRNPDRISIGDAGFEYKFKNIIFRVEWGDVEEIELKETRAIHVRLRDPKKVAYNSLVDGSAIPTRSQFNPYNWIALRRVGRLKSP